MKLKEIKTEKLKHAVINVAWECLCNQTFFMDAEKKRKITPLLEKLAQDPENEFEIYSDARFEVRSEETADVFEPSEETCIRWEKAIKEAI